MITPAKHSGIPAYFPAILATNKQVHDEADGILYGQTSSVVEICCLGKNKWQPPIVAKAKRGVFTYAVNLIRTVNLETTAYNWSSALPKFKSLRIVVTFPAMRKDQFGAAVNHVLYSLVSYLACSKRLESVTFACDDGSFAGSPDISSDELERVLWPITQLPQLDTTTLASLPSGVASAIRSKHITGVAEVDVLAKFIETRAKVRKLDYQVLPLMLRCECGKSEQYVTDHRVRHLKHRLELLVELLEIGESQRRYLP